MSEAVREETHPVLEKMIRDQIQEIRSNLRQEAMRLLRDGIRLNPVVFPELYEKGFYDIHAEEYGKNLPHYRKTKKKNRSETYRESNT